MSIFKNFSHKMMLFVGATFLLLAVVAQSDSSSDDYDPVPYDLSTDLIVYGLVGSNILRSH